MLKIQTVHAQLGVIREAISKGIYGPIRLNEETYEVERDADESEAA